MNDKNRANAIDSTVGANVRRIRTLRHMGQETLAAQIGVTFQQVQKYEKGANRISASKLVLISEALDCDLTSLFEGVTLERGAPIVPSLSIRAVRLATIYDRLTDESVREALFKLTLAMTADLRKLSDD